MVSHQSYRHSIPGIDMEELGGLLIVVEGPDSSGRSTQIWLLSRWLEQQGFAVEQMGLKRSKLVANELEQAKNGNVMSPRTMALFYATDFYDQLENRILPALRSGLIVLADRYIYTLIARGVARGLHRQYLHGIYEKALRPDLTIWLDVRPELAFERLFKKSQAISYWEAGRDMFLSSDLYQSFIRYQTMIRKEFDFLAKHYGLKRLDGERTVPEINRDLRKAIAAQLRIRSTRYQPSHALAHLWR